MPGCRGKASRRYIIQRKRRPERRVFHVLCTQAGLRLVTSEVGQALEHARNGRKQWCLRMRECEKDWRVGLVGGADRADARAYRSS